MDTTFKIDNLLECSLKFNFTFISWHRQEAILCKKVSKRDKKTKKKD